MLTRVVAVSLALEREASVGRLSSLLFRLRLGSCPRGCRSHLLRRWSLATRFFSPTFPPPVSLFPLIALSWWCLFPLAAATHAHDPALSLVFAHALRHLPPLYFTLVAFSLFSHSSPRAFTRSPPARRYRTHPWGRSSRFLDRILGHLLSSVLLFLRISYFASTTTLNLFLAPLPGPLLVFFPSRGLPTCALSHVTCRIWASTRCMFMLGVFMLRDLLDTASLLFFAFLLPLCRYVSSYPPAFARLLLIRLSRLIYRCYHRALSWVMTSFLRWSRGFDSPSLDVLSLVLPTLLRDLSRGLVFYLSSTAHRLSYSFPIYLFWAYAFLTLYITRPFVRCFCSCILTLRGVVLSTFHAPAAFVSSVTLHLDSPALDVLSFMVLPLTRTLRAQLAHCLVVLTHFCAKLLTLAFFRPLSVALLHASLSRSFRRLLRLMRSPSTLFRGVRAPLFRGWCPVPPPAGGLAPRRSPLAYRHLYSALLSSSVPFWSPSPLLARVPRHLPAALFHMLLLLSTNPASLLNPGPPPSPPAMLPLPPASPPPSPCPPPVAGVAAPVAAGPFFAPPPPPLLAVAWNVRGLTSRLAEVHTLLTCPSQYARTGPRQTPDILVLTETLLNGRLARKQSIRYCLEGRPEARHATAFFSHRTTLPSQRVHRRGVGIVVKRCWAPFTTQSEIANPLLRGSLCVVDIRHGAAGPCFLRIVGVYLPTQSRAGSALRGLLLDFIKAEQETCDASPTPYHLLLCGDINAALFPTDRPSHSLTATDKQWGLFTASTSLAPLDPPLPGAARAHSYETNDVRATSRIDDILSLPRTRACATPLLSPVLHSCCDHTSDHHPVLAAFDLPSLGASRPPPSLPEPLGPPHEPAPWHPPPPPHLPNSITAEQLDQVRLRVQQDCQTDILAAHLLVRNSFQPPTDPNTADSVINLLDGVVTALHTRIFSIALDVCGRTRPRSDRSTLPRRAQCQGFFPATVAKPMSAARSMATLCRHALGAARRPICPTSPVLGPWHSAQEISLLSLAVPALSPSLSELSSPAPPVSWLSRVGRHKSAAARQARILCRAHVATLNNAESAKLHTQLVRQPKRAHASILGTDAATQLVALRTTDPFNPTAPPVIIHEPTPLLASLAEQYHASCAPVSVPSSPPPWTTLGLPGSRPFRLRTARTTSHPLPPNLQLFDMLDCADGRVVFDSVLSDSRNKRAAGPDGIPNEVLKSLPHSYHDLLYDIFRLQLKLRRTLPSWKTSTTILIHKKGDTTVLSNFRPIGLANCAYKLWTACLTDLLGSFCETTGILSDGQAGFREDRRCLHQLLYLTSIIEDAHIFHKNLYVLYVDWANAFGSVDHSRLTTMLDLLGVPQDAIEVVANLYSGASTRLRVPAGLTEPSL